MTRPPVPPAQATPELAARIDTLLLSGLASTRLPADIASLHRNAMRATGRVTTLRWFMIAAALNLCNIGFDFGMIPPHVLTMDILFRLTISISFALGGLMFQRDAFIPCEAALALIPCLVTMLLAGITGLASGEPQLFERLITDSMVVVLSATIFLFIDIEYTCWLAGGALLIMIGFIIASPIQPPAAKGQIIFFYAGAQIALLWGRYMLNQYRARLFLLNTRDDLRNAEAARTAAILSREASIDPLTNVANRRAFDDMARDLADARQHLMPVSLCMIDIDHFKQLNDSVGHLQGDLALRAVAGTIASHLRGGSDIVARFGGDEFLLLLANTAIAEALEIAERIRAAIEALELPTPGQPAQKVTVSIGVSAVMGRQISIEMLIAEADRALYRAKAAGRNKVSI
jgi:diguanylate cyclase (GGDEF)-like protein